MYTILYVDDEPGLLEIGKLFLEQSGRFSVDIVTSAPAAFTLLNSKAYDAIISDYQMPGMDGVEFLKNVRSSGNTIPFILFTGRGREEIVIQALNEGADFYLQKGGEPTSQFVELANMVTHAVRVKRNEMALRKSEELYRNLFDNMLNGFAYCKMIYKNNQVVDFTYLAVNSAFEKQTGLRDVVGKNVSEIIPGIQTADPELFAIYGRVASTTKPEQFETFVEALKMWFHVSVYCPKQGYFVAIFDVITERKRAEEELRRKHTELYAAYEQLTATEEELRQNYDELAKSQELIKKSEKQYRNVVEDQTEFISRFLPDGTHVFVNEAYCRYFGLKRDEILGHRFRPRIPPEDRERVKRFFAALTREHPIDTIENRIIMPDGALRWQWWSDRAIFDSSGTVTEYQAVGRDITEEKTTEVALQESEQRLSSIYNTVGDVIFQLAVEPDEQYRFTSVNRAFSRVTGLPAEHVIGRNVNEIIPEPSLAMVLEKYRQAIKEKAIVQWEEISNYPTGQLTGDVSIAPIFDETGTCSYLIGSVHDITERKRAEDALNQANRKLNLLTGITRHDITNQLTTLQGYLAMLEMNRPDPTFKEYLQKAKTTAEHISATIKFTREYESIGVNAPVWQDCRVLVDTAATQVPLDGVMMINDLPAGTEVFADPLVQKVFYNLIDNARRYGGSGMTKIRFFSSETGNGLILSCEDNGDGITGEDKKRLFERGFGKNTGLGLFLSREILSITGITITENGVPGKGARFEIMVPEGAYRIADAQ
jgi:PAS domain S-box-containing protein